MATTEPTYDMEFDFPVTEMTVPAQSQLRRSRDIIESRTDLDSLKLMRDPDTGLVFLRPDPLSQDVWNNPDTVQPIIQLDEWERIPSGWEDAPEPGIHHHSLTGASAAKRKIVRAIGSSAAAFHIPGKPFFQTKTGKQLRTVLQSYAQFPANQPFHATLWRYGNRTFAGWSDRMGLRFGDFVLVFSDDGYADLYHSASNWQSGSYTEFKKRLFFNGEPSTPTGGIKKQDAFSITVIPMATGFIYFRFSEPGRAYETTYFHKEAVLDPATKLWKVTAAGTVGFHYNDLSPVDYNIQVTPVRFPTTVSFDDGPFELETAPGVSPTTAIYGGYTQPKTEIRLSVVDAQNPNVGWAPSQQRNSYKTRVTLVGDGDSTPFFAGYAVDFPAEHRTRARTPWTTKAIKSISFTESLRPAEQQCDVVLLHNIVKTPKLPEYDKLEGLWQHSEIVGRLRRIQPKTETAPSGGVEILGSWLFSGIHTIHGREISTIELKGTPLGMAKLRNAVWNNPPSLTGLEHPVAIKKCLNYSGILDKDLDITQDPRITLPGTVIDGDVADDSEADAQKFPGMPTPGIPVEDTVAQIVADYGWDLRFDIRTQKFIYSKLTFPTKAEVTFANTSPRPKQGDAKLIYQDDNGDVVAKYSNLITQTEPPAANKIIVYGGVEGQKVVGQGPTLTTSLVEAEHVLASMAVDTASIENPNAANYIGREKTTIIFDSDLKKIEEIDRMLLRRFEKARTTIVWFEWMGPYIKKLRVGDGVKLGGLIDRDTRDTVIVMLTEIDVTVGRWSELEGSGMNCRYVGVLYMG